MSSEYIGAQLALAAQGAFSCPEAEENIVRRMLKKPEEADAAIEGLTGADFADAQLGRLFSAIKLVRAQGSQVDFATVDAAFTKRFPKNADQIRQRMIDLIEFRPYTLADGQGIADHIRIVKELSLRRAAIEKMEALAKGLRDPAKELSAALSEIRDAAEEADADSGEDWVTLDEVNLATYEYLEKRQRGEIRSVTTGIRSLDELTGGLFGGELTIVAARPSVGKSAFGLNAAMKAAKEGFKVGFVSCEMDNLGFGQRTLSRQSFVSGDRLRKAQIAEEDWDRLAYALSEMHEMPVAFMFNRNTKGGITVENVFTKVGKRAKRREIDLLVVDYIGIMRTELAFKEERLRIAHISGELKRLAMAANIPVLALCQVNRMAQGRMPTLAELRDSGAVEQDADTVIFLHRPEGHDDKSVNPKDVAGFYAMQEAGGVYIAISVAKQRNGATGMTQVMFDPGVMRYSEILRENQGDGVKRTVPMTTRVDV